MIGYHNKERLRLVYTYAQYDRELLEPDIDIGENLQIKPSQVETLALNGGWNTWATTTKPMRFFSISSSKCFRNKSDSVSETKINFFSNENVFI